VPLESGGGLVLKPSKNSKNSKKMLQNKPEDILKKKTLNKSFNKSAEICSKQIL